MHSESALYRCRGSASRDAQGHRWKPAERHTGASSPTIVLSMHTPRRELGHVQPFDIAVDRLKLG
jgi:hypothetical protein